MAYSSVRLRRVSRCIAVLIAGSVGFFASPASSDPVIDVGRDALMLHFIDHAGWHWPVGCRAGSYRQHSLVYCYPSGDRRTGSLFALVSEDGRPVVYPINGKAMTYTKGFRTIQAVDTSRVEVRPWPGELINIPEAIETCTKLW